MAALPFRIEAYLKKYYIPYQVTCHVKTHSLEQAAAAVAIPEEQVARSILLKDTRGPLMVVLPLTRLLHLTQLRERLGRKLEVVSGLQADCYFPDCEPGSRPPLGEAYGISTIIDKSLLDQPEVYFEPGNHRVFVKIQHKEFLVLVSKFSKMDISVPQTFANKAGKIAKQQQDDLLTDESQRLCHTLTALPHFPKKTQELTSLLEKLLTSEVTVETTQPCAERQHEFEEFVAIFNSEFCLLPEEISRCILSTKIVVSFLASLPITTDGPLGYNQIVKQSIYTAFLAGMLAYKRNDAANLEPSKALLAAGCLHAGVLLLGHLFPPEFRVLNRLALAHPSLPITNLEQRLLGMGRAHDVLALGHAQVGAWLLKTWGFPLEVTTVVAKQYQLNYNGYATDYAAIIQTAQRTLAYQGLWGEARGGHFSASADAALVEAKLLLQKLLLHSAFLDKIISRISSSSRHSGERRDVAIT